MKEETEFKPKPLVLVGGKPILWHIMKIYAHHGFNEFILALGYKGEMIKQYFLNWKSMSSNFTLSTKDHEITFHDNACDDFKITFIETGLDSLTGERVRRLKKYIDGDDFMVTYGDGVGDVNIKELADFHKRQNTLGTITGIKLTSRFGLLDIDYANKKIKNFYQHKVTDFSQPRDDYKAGYINGGFMIFKKEVLDLIMPDSMIEFLFPALIKGSQLSIYAHPGKWKCMDTYKEVEELNDLWHKEPFWKIWEN